MLISSNDHSDAPAPLTDAGTPPPNTENSQNEHFRWTKLDRNALYSTKGHSNIMFVQHSHFSQKVVETNASVFDHGILDH